MSRENEIHRIFSKNGVSEWGAVKARVFSEHIKECEKNVPFVSAAPDERINPFYIMENAQSIIVYLIPYKTGGERTNLSEYAKGRDYHIVSEKISKAVCEYLNSLGFETKFFCDNGVLDDRYIAYLAGLGVYGKNGLLINKKYGSYTFIGYIITDCKVQRGTRQKGSCAKCGRCIQSCPGRAISESGICYEKCASYITQKKGELSSEEADILKKSGYVWGCDICQEVCPHNASAECTKIEDFTNNLILSLENEGLSNRKFMNKYKERAFSWRGAGVVQRNLDISGK